MEMVHVCKKAHGLSTGQSPIRLRAQTTPAECDLRGLATLRKCDAIHLVGRDARTHVARALRVRTCGAWRVDGSCCSAGGLRLASRYAPRPSCTLARSADSAENAQDDVDECRCSVRLRRAPIQKRTADRFSGRRARDQADRIRRERKRATQPRFGDEAVKRVAKQSAKTRECRRALRNVIA